MPLQNFFVPWISSMASLVFHRPTEAQAHVLGGWDLAICLTLFLQGVLCSQFATYMDSKRRDSVRMKLFVAGLALLTTLKTIQALAIMWIQNVTLFEDLEAASTMWKTDWLTKALILEATVAFYVQMFFCHRLWASAISRNVYIVVVCITVFSLGLISGVVATVFILAVKKEGLTSPSHWFATHLGVVVCGDFILTGSVVFWLLRHNGSVLSRGPTANILSSLVRLTLQASRFASRRHYYLLMIGRQSAAPVALCALVNFVVIMLKSRQPSSTVLLMIDFITNNMLPQLYAWSAMWTLNSREDIVLAGGNRPYTFDLGTTSSHLKTPRISHADENSAVAHRGDQV
ncbi:hypothetical protein B0H12DRAFT_1231393 [Mycena haematopus]|nr:hypothetical protein B0H12DRAFT_1231393 [Mycena haematopus]